MYTHPRLVQNLSDSHLADLRRSGAGARVGDPSPESARRFTRTLLRRGVS